MVIWLQFQSTFFSSNYHRLCLRLPQIEHILAESSFSENWAYTIASLTKGRLSEGFHVLFLLHNVCYTKISFKPGILRSRKCLFCRLFHESLAHKLPRLGWPFALAVTIALQKNMNRFLSTSVFAMLLLLIATKGSAQFGNLKTRSKKRQTTKEQEKSEQNRHGPTHP